MICPNCQTINDNESVFCVNCGNAVSPAPTSYSGTNPPPTVQFPASGQFSNQNYQPSQSIETSVVSFNQNNPSPNFNPAIPYTNDLQPEKDNKKFIFLGLAVFVFLIIVGGGIFFISRQNLSTETLPDHLGMFVQSREKDKVDEVKKSDFANALTGRDSLLKDDSLPTLDSEPNLILYSDGKDIPLNDLRLIQLDTIKDDGNLKTIDFQAAPVEGKPEMKRIRIPGGIANGKYAFALLDGFLNDGKHKFWAFQVKNASKSENGDSLKTAVIDLKPNSPTQSSSAVKSSQPTMPKVPPPANGSVAYSTSSKLVLRSGPTQSSAKIRNLYQGEKVYIIEYSSNYESFKNLYSNFALVQTESGERGWAYAAYLR